MNLETISIEDLATLRDRVIRALSDKVAARQKELLAESERGGALVTSKPSTVRPKRPIKYRDGIDLAWAKLKGDTLESYRVQKGHLSATLQALEKHCCLNRAPPPVASRQFFTYKL